MNGDKTPLLAAPASSAQTAAGHITVILHPPRQRSPRDTRRGLVALAALCAILILAPSPLIRDAWRYHFGRDAVARPSAPEKDPFAWHACKDAPQMQCGSLEVPLNHLNNSSSAPKIKLAVVKYVPDSAEPLLGTIVINPGGPGGSGVSTVKYEGERISRMAGGRHAILGFDPRGVGYSFPVKCFATAGAQSALRISQAAIGIPGLTSASPHEFAAMQELNAEGCRDIAGEDVLPLFSTAFTARDLDLIRQALGVEHLNYWGFSYGTFLGTTYANMFPSHVGRMILDGVVDPTHWVSTVDNFVFDILVQRSIEAFASECEAAGTLRCPLAGNRTAGPIMHRIRHAIETLSARPVPVVKSKTPQVLNGQSIVAVLFQASYVPTSWPAVAFALSALLDDHDPFPLSELNAFIGVGGDVCPLAVYDQGFPVIRCLDGSDMRGTTPEAWESLAARVQEQDIFGRPWVYFQMTCNYWPVRPLERYDGPWNNTLSNKIMLIGNTIDPVTPLSSAKAMERHMGGNAVLLHQDGYGHCSMNMPTQCTMDAIRRYYVEGILPEGGSFSANDFVLFPPEDTFAAISVELRDALVIGSHVAKVNRMF